MPTQSSAAGYSFLVGPVVALLVIGVLTLLLRWTFQRGGSLVASRPRVGAETDYGLLVSVASPGTYVEGEIARQRLLASGIRATLAPTAAGPRLMVFTADEAKARTLLAKG